MIEFSHKGDFTSTFLFLKRVKKLKLENLDQFGRAGVEALRQATPKDSGETANSWYYEIVRDNTDGRVTIQWLNSHVEKNVNIAIILQYGHGTRNGGWVEGRDYINPAIQPIFDKIAEGAWKEVTKK